MWTVYMNTIHRQHVKQRHSVITVTVRQQTMDTDPFAGGLSKYYPTSNRTAQVQPHTESGHNGDVVTFTHKADLKLQRYELSTPHLPQTHTHTRTQTKLYVDKAMRTSSIQPAVICTSVNMMHKTHNTGSRSVPT